MVKLRKVEGTDKELKQPTELRWELGHKYVDRVEKYKNALQAKKELTKFRNLNPVFGKMKKSNQC